MGRKRTAVPPRGWKNLFARCAYPAKIGLLLLLVLLLAAGPVYPVFAEMEPGDQKSDSAGLLATVSTIFAAAVDYIQRDHPQPGVPPVPEEDLSSILASLDQFSLEVLKDPRMAEIINSIIAEIVGDEDLPGSIQNNKEFIGEIIRDPRLTRVFGEIITDYLQDERLAKDIEDLFNIAFDLINQKDLHYFIRDCLAALLENKALEKTMNDLLLTATGAIYCSGSDTIAALLTDERIPEMIKEIVVPTTGAVPELLSLLLVSENRERMLGIAEDILLVMARYGTDLPPDLLEDPRLREGLADIMLIAADPYIYEAVASTGEELTGYFLNRAAQHLTADQTVENMLGNMVHDFFKTNDAELQTYFLETLTTLISRARAEAIEAASQDEMIKIPPFIEVNACIQKSIADGVAKVPPQLAKYAAFMWLVDGNPEPPYSETPGLDPAGPRTYRQLGHDLGGLLKEDDRALALAAALNSDLKAIIDSYLMEHREEISGTLHAVVAGVPLDRTAQEIRDNDADLKRLSRILVKRIIASFPLEEMLLSVVQEGDNITGAIAELTGQLIDELPFDKAARFIINDRRLLRAIEEALPHISLSKLADTIRRNDWLTTMLAEAASELPVVQIIDFIQDDKHAELIGQIAAGTLLNMVADFTEDEQLASFIQGFLLDAISSLEGTPGTLILDSLARFIENEDFARYLAEFLYETAYGMKTELWYLYKCIVPRFFTYAIWHYF